MERCSISAATIAGKHFCPHLPVPNLRVSLDAVADKVSQKGKKNQAYQNIIKSVNYINPNKNFITL